MILYLCVNVVLSQPNILLRGGGIYEQSRSKFHFVSDRVDRRSSILGIYKNYLQAPEKTQRNHSPNGLHVLGHGYMGDNFTNVIRVRNNPINLTKPCVHHGVFILLTQRTLLLLLLFFLLTLLLFLSFL